MKTIWVVGLLSCFMSTATVYAQYPSGAEVARQEMAKALAEKSRNDAIVERQRAAERGRKEAERIDRAERKGRTG